MIEVLRGIPNGILIHPLDMAGYSWVIFIFCLKREGEEFFNVTLRRGREERRREGV
jgi:hypothetical protein